MKTKRCTKCRDIKPIDAFCKQTSAPDGLNYHCRECRSKTVKDNPTRRIFYGMKQRCYDPNSSVFEYYGGRGIVICDEWLTNPRSFCKWAKANGYQKGLHIDRIDTNRGYSPDNCHFVTSKTNNENLRTSRWWFVHGKRYGSLSEAAKDYNVPRSTVGGWCRGYTVDGKFYPPRKGCYTEPKYD